MKGWTKGLSVAPGAFRTPGWNRKQRSGGWAPHLGPFTSEPGRLTLSYTDTLRQARAAVLLTDKPICEANRLRGHSGLVACHLRGNDDCLTHVGCDGFGETWLTLRNPEVSDIVSAHGHFLTLGRGMWGGSGKEWMITEELPKGNREQFFRV